MSTIKITDLNSISPIDANTSNTILVGVNLVTDITGKITATDLAGRLYWNNPLIVGSNPILFSNTIAQFSGNDATYLQTNFQNFTSSGSADVVLTSDTGTNSNNYIDLGINNSAFSDPTFSSMKPLDGYLYVSGPTSTSYTGNLVIGTSSYGANIVFIAGGTTSSNVVAVFNEDVLTLGLPTTINQIPGDYDGSLIPAFVINNYGNSYSLLINDDYPSDASPFTIDNNGNTAIGSLSSNGYKLLVVGNTYFAGNVSTSGTLTLADGSIPASNSFVQANDTITLTAAKSYTDTANTWLQANDTVTLTTSKSYTDSANSWIRSNYLANTPNTLFNGTLNIGDKLNVNGSVIFANTNFSNTQAALTIAACPIGDVQLPSNDGYMLHISGKQNVSSRIVFDSFGANTYAVVAGRVARGTPTTPQAVANGDILLRLSGNGYGTTKYSTLGSGRIDIVATETHTDTSRATQIQFFTTIAGTNTQTQIASFNGQTATFTGLVNPQKGFIYNPNVISGIINTLSIDIANNSLYRFTCNNTTTISLNNFYPGKVVEVWLTNVDTGPGSNHTITHGCYANNSTIGATSFTLSSLHSAYLRYFSIDGDLANTFVSINYS